MKILYLILISYLAYSSPTITLQPQSENICHDTEDFELSVQAISNSGTLNYQWMRDGKDLIDGIESPFETNQASLKFFPADYEMSGVYTCDIWEESEGRQNAVNSDTAVVYVLQKPSFIESNKRYVILPKKDSILKFKVDGHFDDSEEVTYQWYVRSDWPEIFTKVQNLTDEGFNSVPFTGMNTNELSFNFINHRDSINNLVLADLSYFCVVETKCGSFVSKDYNFLPPKDMLDLEISSGYGDSYPCRYDYFTARIFLDDYWLSFTYTNLYDSGPFDVTWEVTDYKSKYDFFQDTIGISAYFDPMQNDFFEFQCNIFLDNYIDTTIKFRGMNNKYPVIKNEPQDLTSTINSSVTFSSDIYDFESFAGVEWKKNGKKIENERIRIKTYSLGVSYLIRSDLIIENVNIEDEGFYSLEARNRCQNKSQSRIAKLTVLENENVPLSVEDSKFNLISSPNPFYSQNKLEFNLDKASAVKIELFDARGMQIAILEDKYLLAGKHNYSINSDKLNLNSGVYFYVVNIGGEVITKEIIKIN